MLKLPGLSLPGSSQVVAVDPYGLLKMCALWQSRLLSSWFSQHHFFVWISAIIKSGLALGELVFSTKIAALCFSDTDTLSLAAPQKNYSFTEYYEGMDLWLPLAGLCWAWERLGEKWSAMPQKWWGISWVMPFWSGFRKKVFWDHDSSLFRGKSKFFFLNVKASFGKKKEVLLNTLSHVPCQLEILSGTGLNNKFILRLTLSD